jgi:AcrR family transcriptional regulator
MGVQLMRRDEGALSLRDLSAAAGVAIPTLRHYFGGRAEVVDAIFEDCLRQGNRRLEHVRQPDGPFAQSVHAYVHDLVFALEQKRDVPLGDLIAVSLAEGFFDTRISASTIEHVLDPTIDALEARLRTHIERGEMAPCAPRAAALMLLSPILLAALHQHQLNGAALRPLSLETVAEEVAAAFLRAYALTPAPGRD